MSLSHWLLGLGSCGWLAIAMGCQSSPTVESARSAHDRLNYLDYLVTSVLARDVTTIAAIVSQDPATFTPSAQAVTIEGRVLAVAPLLEGQLYQLQDDTGVIWVLTQQAEVAVGDRRIVTGTVTYTSIPLGGQERGEFYLQEDLPTAPAPNSAS